MISAVAPTAADCSVARPRAPGEDGFWVFIFGDMSIFALLFGSFLVARTHSPAQFASSRAHLSLTFGTTNTLVLLTSSILVALSAQAFRAQRVPESTGLIRAAQVFALTFIVVKGFEWHGIFATQPHLAANPFFVYYFGLTGLHLLHLLIGSIGLGLVARSMRKPNKHGRFIIEAGSCYWHMVDMIWIVIFPLLYLVA